MLFVLFVSDVKLHLLFNPPNLFLFLKFILIIVFINYLYVMITINGYKNMTYGEFQKELYLRFVDSDKTYLQVASELGVKTHITAQNAFNTERQAVSDEVLTKVMKSVGLSGFVLWVFGKKYYYIKNK